MFPWIGHEIIAFTSDVKLDFSLQGYACLNALDLVFPCCFPISKAYWKLVQFLDPTTECQPYLWTTYNSLMNKLRLTFTLAYTVCISDCMNFQICLHVVGIWSILEPHNMVSVMLVNYLLITPFAGIYLSTEYWGFPETTDQGWRKSVSWLTYHSKSVAHLHNVQTNSTSMFPDQSTLCWKTLQAIFLRRYDNISRPRSLTPPRPPQCFDSEAMHSVLSWRPT